MNASRFSRLAFPTGLLEWRYFFGARKAGREGKKLLELAEEAFLAAGFDAVPLQC
jgi:hypothetical protein